MLQPFFFLSGIMVKTPPHLKIKKKGNMISHVSLGLDYIILEGLITRFSLISDCITGFILTVIENHTKRQLNLLLHPKFFNGLIGISPFL